MPIPCVQIPPPLNAWFRRDRRASVEMQAPAGVRDTATATELAGVDVARDSHPVQVDGRDKREHLGGVAIGASRSLAALVSVIEFRVILTSPSMYSSGTSRPLVSVGRRAVRSLPGDGQRSGTDDARRTRARASHDERLAVGSAVHCRREVRIRATHHSNARPSRSPRSKRASCVQPAPNTARTTTTSRPERHDSRITTPRNPQGIDSNVRSCRAPLRLAPAGGRKTRRIDVAEQRRQLRVRRGSVRPRAGKHGCRRMP